MTALNLKLLRDLWHMKSQAVAIALVIGSGVATYVMSKSTYDALTNTQAAFYREGRFAEVFAAVKRAPESLRGRLEEIPGVQQVQTRVIAAARLEVEGFSDPVTGQIMSIPDNGRPLLNQVTMTSGRLPEPARDNEVLVNEAFAGAHHLKPGGHIHAIINGRRRKLDIVGIGLSPDTIYQLGPGSLIPDFKTFGILWMARTPIEAAYGMEGAFNEVSMTVSQGANAQDVVDRLDEMLARYGCLGAYERKHHISHRFLTEEFKQLQQMSKLFPTIFLGVAAFLLNVVVTRLIATQREQVAILKAFGYTNASIVFHYLKLVGLIVVFGVAAGVAGGVWIGSGMSNMYMMFYRFPYMLYHLRPSIVWEAGLISGLAALGGTVYSVMRAALLPPAEAMQPPKPAKYRVSLVERMGMRHWISQPTRMIIRNIERRPLKSLLTVIGVAFACAIVVLGGFFRDSIDYMVDTQFRTAQREDVTLRFVEPVSSQALHSLKALPGIEHIEPTRSVSVRFRNGYRSYPASILGFATRTDLRRLLDIEAKQIDLPSDGLVMTDYLAGLLGVRVGDRITVEVLEGRRPVLQIAVTGLIREFLGVSAYMQIPALNRLMREGEVVSGAYLQVDSRLERQVFDEIKAMPRIAGTVVREKMLQNFYEIMARQMLLMVTFNTVLAVIIAFGVVYNSMRIALAERARELASLRVLGFTRGEISYILLGELSLLMLAALPAGMLLGYWGASAMISTFQNELFRFYAVVQNKTYAFAVTVVLASALVSAAIVKRRLDRLDLVEVLKTKE